MKIRPLGTRLAAMAVAVVACAAIAIPVLSGSTAGASPWTPPASPSTTAPFNECPAIGQSTQGCAVLIILPATGPAQILFNTNTDCGTGGTSACDGPFDGHDDTLVGVLNQTEVAIPTVALSSNTDIFNFDGDGICSGKYGSWTGSTGCDYGTTGYEGPGTSFSGYSHLTDFKVGNVNFSGGGLGAGTSTFFSLESSLQGANFTIPASFVVTKGASPSSVYAGSSTPITYTLTAQNIGGVAGDLTISDGIPTGSTYVASSAACPTVTSPETCNAGYASGVVSYDITNVPAGASIAVTFQVTANSSDPTGTIDNTAIWSGPGCSAPIVTSTTTDSDNTDSGSVVTPDSVAPTTCDTNTTTTTVTAPTPLLITASDTSSVYGTTPTVTPTYTPNVVPSTPPTCSTTVTNTTAVGAYSGANTCGGAADPAYAITYAPGTATVTPAPLTATASNGTFVYGGTGGSTPAVRDHALPAITAAVTGFVNGQTSAIITTQPTCGSTATSSSPVGTYPTTCSGGVAPNYTFNYVAGVMTVTPAPLTITASSGSANIGGTIPAVTPSYAGFVNGDSASSLSTAPTCSTTATSSSPAGTYPTSCTGAVDPNYTISYVPGTIGLTEAAVAAAGTTTPTTPTTAPAAASTSPAIAFTGAFLDQEWIFGVGALFAGMALLLIGRRLRASKNATK